MKRIDMKATAGNYDDDDIVISVEPIPNSHDNEIDIGNCGIITKMHIEEDIRAVLVEYEGVKVTVEKEFTPLSCTIRSRLKEALDMATIKKKPSYDDDPII